MKREFSLEPINKNKFDVMKIDLMIIEDFKEYFDWISITGFQPGFSVNYYTVRNIHLNEKFDINLSGSFQTSREVIYTMLKGVGANVSRYGLKEIYLSVDDNQKLIRE